MADIVRGRHKAEIDGDFVVFLIGARLSLRHPIRPSAISVAAAAG